MIWLAEFVCFTVAMSCYFKFSKFNCPVLAHGGYLPENFVVVLQLSNYKANQK